MNREEVAADVAAKHERRTEAVRRSIYRSPDILSAREQLRQGLSSLPGVSGDTRTIEDMMLFVDTYVHQKEELDTRAGRFDRRV
jgi:hypothetical protein